MNRGAIVASAVAVLVAAFAGRGWIADNIGIPPYAAAGQVAELAKQVDLLAGNSLLAEIRWAAQSGNRPLLIKLCNDFIRQNGWKPGECP